VFDVVYFVLGYALIPLMIGSINIRKIAFIFLPLVSTMLIALFMIKEKSTRPEDVEEIKDEEKEETVGVIESVKYAFKNEDFIKWMGIYFLMQFGVQMFLSGQNVYCSGVALFSGWQITVLNALSFAPVPLTLILYNKIINKYGFKTAFRYSLGVFSIGMIVFTFINSIIIPNDTLRFVLGCLAALICSFSIGSFFSIGYVVPSGLAVREKEKTGISHPAMYFAVQGLVGGVSTGISTGLIWVTLKNTGNTWMMGIVVATACLLSLLFTKFLPESLNNIGKVE
jgi:Na+/melibiose symporter-like transporter